MSIQHLSLTKDIYGYNDKREKLKLSPLLEKTYRAHLVWEGTEEDTELEKFKRYIEKKYLRYFKSDRDFHKWSIDHFEDYWESVWKYFDIIASKPYEKVFLKTGPGFLDNDWFTEAKFNYAENLMRYRDDTIALMYEDEEGNSDSVTYAQMYKEVERYAAAFRKHGLIKGDRVACQMSNRLEVIYAMLATMSIGAIWSGSIPYFGARVSANIINKIEAKILIAVDRFQENEKEYEILSCLPAIIEDATTLEKVIIVPSRRKILSENISHIRNGCFLHEFLKSGVQEDGTVPELVFEQLPASHPVFICFTSGTTGLSKGIVHFARVLLHGLTSMNFYGDITRGDVVFSNFPVGWIPILFIVSCLALGAKLFLYNGGFYFVKKSRNIWDVFSEAKVKYGLISPSQVDEMEKLNIVPKPSLCLDSLKGVFLTSSPVKTSSIKFLNKCVPKTTLVSNLYGATEFFGKASGVYLKTKSYAGELQLPCLGTDIRFYNEDGLPVYGELGILVVATPTPCLPTCLWKDTDRSILNANYLSKFPGTWCQHDSGWINPYTHGILVKGRSDDTFTQDGDRFGPADIYFAIQNIDEIDDYICTAQNRSDGDERVVLFVKMKKGCEFTPSFRAKLAQTIESELFVDCVPKVILPIKEIPYSNNNKKVENVVRKILAANKVPDYVNIKNPECLKSFCNIPEIVSYYLQ